MTAMDIDCRISTQGFQGSIEKKPVRKSDKAFFWKIFPTNNEWFCQN
jgi:hypothetical protein